MEQEILHVHFTPSLSDGTVSPACPQYAGVQGDRNAAQLSFSVPTTLRGTAFRYRIEGVDGAGGYISTELLTLDDEGKVATLLDERFTAAGGQILVRLVVSEISGDNEVSTVHSFDGRLYFADAPKENVSSAFRDTLSAMVARTDEKLKEMEELAEELSEDIEDLDDRVTENETKLTAHGTRLTTAETTLTSHGTRLTTAESTLTSHGTRLTAAESTLTSHGTRLDSHDTRFTTDEAAIDELDEWVEDVSEKLLELTGVAETKEEEAVPDDRIPFRTYSENFKLIDNQRTVSIAVCRDEYSKNIYNEFCKTGRINNRKIQKYSCTVYVQEFERLLNQRVIEDRGTGVFFLTDLSYYDEQLRIGFEGKDFIL